MSTIAWGQQYESGLFLHKSPFHLIAQVELYNNGVLPLYLGKNYLFRYGEQVQFIRSILLTPRSKEANGFWQCVFSCRSGLNESYLTHRAVMRIITCVLARWHGTFRCTTLICFIITVSTGKVHDTSVNFQMPLQVNSPWMKWFITESALKALVIAVYLHV